MTTVLYSVIFGLIVALILQGALHHFERKDLYNRLIGNGSVKPKKKDGRTPTAHERTLNKWRGRGDIE